VKKTIKKWFYLSALFIAVFSFAAFYHSGIFSISPIDAQTPAAPSDDQDAAQLQALQAAIQPDEQKITAALGQTDMVSLLINPASNKQAVALLIPAFSDMVSQFDVFLQKNPDLADQICPVQYHFIAILSILGDPNSLARLQRDSSSNNSITSQSASLGLLEFNWWKNTTNAQVQAQVLDSLKAMAVKNPNDDGLAAVAYSMYQAGAANKDLTNEARDIILKNLTGPFAQQMQSQLQMQAAQDALIGKPIVVSGVALDGRQISSSDLKGKPILVDFWATWCGPCVSEVPEIQSLYEKYHPAGLEIIGVSQDNDPTALKTFLQQHPSMVWPQLFDANHPGNNPVALQFNVMAYPTQFLIDRDGILRNIIVGVDPNNSQQLSGPLADLVGPSAGGAANNK